MACRSVGSDFKQLVDQRFSVEEIRNAYDIPDDFTPSQKKHLERERVWKDDAAYAAGLGGSLPVPERPSSPHSSDDDAKSGVGADRVVACSPRRDGGQTWLVARVDGLLQLRPTAAVQGVAKCVQLHNMNVDALRLQRLELGPATEGSVEVTQTTLSTSRRHAVSLQLRTG